MILLIFLIQAIIVISAYFISINTNWFHYSGISVLIGQIMMLIVWNISEWYSEKF